MAEGPLTEFSGLPVRIAEQVMSRAGPKLAFGDPVTHDGAMVIPVARVRWGFGAGGGGGEEPEEGGTERAGGGGGGAGGSARPLGFIEISGGAARFHPINDPSGLWPVLLAAAIAAWVVLRGVRRILRG